MKILNPNDLPTIDYRTVREFQGDLKDLHHNEQEALHRVLVEDGFDVPFFVWKNPADKAFYLLDGHQRKRVMSLYDLNDDGNYEVPMVQFAAKDEQAAKAKLLKITSQYGRITREGLDEFIAEAELPDYEELDIHFDAITDFEPIKENESNGKPDDKDKVKRYAVSELRVESEKYFESTGGVDVSGFIQWLGEK